MTTAPDCIARAVNVTRSYTLGKETVWALNGVSLDIYRGEYLSIMGPSGSGKSTFFNMIGALDVPTSGTIEFRTKIAGVLARRAAKIAYDRAGAR